MGIRVPWGVIEVINPPPRPDAAIRAVPQIRTGSLVIFRGAESMHRVTRVEASPTGDLGRARRVSAIFNFNPPGAGMLTPYTREKFFGRR